ncbi:MULTISPECIES: L,D-transpeptidase [unclassified Mesorhizobium]|uniref:L,D-transpeptidase n=1 Tax=unclassified Mesorhizobium TaxID=325217 RepID=UPI000F750DAA|nr:MULTISPECIES: L,D-transpeptidase [unclassified Mesorhizobium]RUX03120.1 L,D-transpeptidase [Mesorhizobium sp. M8A.F.Ca.ET.059.01.1.1]RUX06111.1 L,D-transpeptidase [Mesorhizobium sp. M8A.F.Ca.ET.023.01.1.1]TGU92055.1 L,D-transpeptidase [Mesorhizobium sp. M00.F.Ca.ET.151.01.1.1]TGV10676.1 L,D-transpeptidase [Mesorhizobium sp. M8A.F.Ca.ET.173.01.1.1]AZO55635.1 L,D-transpeptidase [Mesorhizobium sp. M8A.F.Ca.ET.057.01.1.1]
MSITEIESYRLSRRGFLNAAALGAASIAVSACATTGPGPAEPPPPTYVEPPLADYASMYAAVNDGGFDLPAIPVDRIDPQFLRQIVPDPTGQKPGTIVVDTTGHFLYLVRPGGQAIRYGVGLGRAGFEWSGDAVVQWKQKWPKWTPPDEMIARQPELKQYSADNGGMPGGLKNPLGARALYLFQGNVDTLYRLHGSPEWRSIGKSVSSGCVRLMNQDIIDLYDRVPSKSPVIVTSNASQPMVATANHKAIPIDAGVPDGSVLLGPVKAVTDAIF